jgi:hypothetical protein
MACGESREVSRDEMTPSTQSLGSEPLTRVSPTQKRGREKGVQLRNPVSRAKRKGAEASP